MKYIIKSTYFIIVTIFLFLVILLPKKTSTASDNIINSVCSNVPVIDDRADLFSDYEEVTILDKAKQQRDQTGFQYIIVTSDHLETGSLTSELEDMYNNYRDNISAGGTVLFLIYKNSNSFECELQGYTKARDYIPHDTCDNIEIRLGGLNANDMLDQLFVYLTEVTDGTYTYAEVAKDNSSYHITFIILIIISCIILMSVVVFFLIPKKSVTSDITLSEPKVHITSKKDTYIRTHKSIYKL